MTAYSLQRGANLFDFSGSHTVETALKVDYNLWQDPIQGIVIEIVSNFGGLIIPSISPAVDVKIYGNAYNVALTMNRMHIRNGPMHMVFVSREVRQK